MACGLICPAACEVLVPPPGIEPESPALEGGFFTTGPPGKSQGIVSLRHNSFVVMGENVLLCWTQMLKYLGTIVLSICNLL